MGINNGFQYLLLLGQGPVVRHGTASQAGGVVWGADQDLGRREHVAPSDSLGWSPLSTLGNWERSMHPESSELGPNKPLQAQTWSTGLRG